MKTIEAKIDAVGGLEPIHSDRFQPLSDPAIEAIEKRLGARLPAVYRDFLATYGLSMFAAPVEFDPIQALPLQLSTNGRGLVEIFYGENPNEADDLNWLIDCYRSRMPDGFLVFAGNGFGDQIVLSTRGHDIGKIYYWAHHYEWDAEDYIRDGKPVPADLKYQNLTLIADSIEDFFNRLMRAEQ